MAKFEVTVTGTVQVSMRLNIEAETEAEARTSAVTIINRDWLDSSAGWDDSGVELIGVDEIEEVPEFSEPDMPQLMREGVLRDQENAMRDYAATEGRGNRTATSVEQMRQQAAAKLHIVKGRIQ